MVDGAILQRQFNFKRNGVSYLQTVAEIRAAASAVNGNRFDHGRRVDFSQNFNKGFPYIWLYPFQVADPVGDAFLDTSTLLMGFWMADRPDTSVEEREQIIGQMDLLCTAFLNQLRLNKLVSATAVTREPQYQMHQSTVSGFAVRFTYQNFAPCIE